MFSIVAMICLGGMAPQECAPVPGYSRDFAIIGEAPNELECGIQAQQSLGRTSIFHDLAPGEFVKVACVKRQ